jgi:hypothetical protein
LVTTEKHGANKTGHSSNSKSRDGRKMKRCNLAGMNLKAH